MKKPRKIKIAEEDEQEDGHGVLGVDTGAGRWFVFDRTGTASRLVAGPYQTEAAAQRLVDGYDPVWSKYSSPVIACPLCREFGPGF